MDGPVDSSIFFLKADLRHSLEEKDEVEQRLQMQSLLETYFSENSSTRWSVPMDLLKKIDDYNRQNEKSASDQLVLLNELDTQVVQQVKQLDLPFLIKGAVSAAIYRKRSGGTGDLPDEVFYKLHDQMDPQRSQWTLRMNKDCTVWTQTGDGCISILESIIVNVPLELAVAFSQFQHGQEAIDEVKAYKRLDILEEIGPMSRIAYMLLKKSFFLMKSMDCLLFYSAKFLDDGTFVNLHHSVDHPKAPLNDPKKIKRVVINYGGVRFAPTGPNQIRLTMIGCIQATKVVQILLPIMTNGTQIRRLKKQMEMIFKKGNAI